MACDLTHSPIRVPSAPAMSQGACPQRSRELLSRSPILVRQAELCPRRVQLRLLHSTSASEAILTRPPRRLQPSAAPGANAPPAMEILLPSGRSRPERLRAARVYARPTLNPWLTASVRNRPGRQRRGQSGREEMPMLLQRSTSSAAFGGLPAPFPAWLKTILAFGAQKARDRSNRLDKRTTALCKFVPPRVPERSETPRLCRREAGMPGAPRFL